MRKFLFVLLLLPLLLCASATYGAKKGGGLVNLPGGSSVLGEATLHHHQVDVGVGSVLYGIVGFGEGFAVVGPINAGWEFYTGPVSSGPAQTLTASWISGGVTHTVTTRVSNGSGRAMDLALKRHGKLITKTKQYFPPDP